MRGSIIIPILSGTTYPRTKFAQIFLDSIKNVQADNTLIPYVGYPVTINVTFANGVSGYEYQFGAQSAVSAQSMANAIAQLVATESNSATFLDGNAITIISSASYSGGGGVTTVNGTFPAGSPPVAFIKCGIYQFACDISSSTSSVVKTVSSSTLTTGTYAVSVYDQSLNLISGTDATGALVNVTA